MVKELADQMTLVFPRRGERVLLARHKRGPFKGKLSGYGGDIEEFDRSPREGACREFEKESTAKADIDDLKYLGTIYFYRKRRCRTCFVYALLKWEGELQETDEMEKAAAYLKGALPFSQMTEGDRHWLSQALAGELHKRDLHVYHNDDWTLDRVEWRDKAA